MNFIANAIINSISIVFVAIIMGVTFKRKNRKFKSYRIFSYLLITTIVLAVLDTLARTDNDSVINNLLLNQIANYIHSSLSPAISSLWLIYVLYMLLGNSRTYKFFAYTTLVYMGLIFALMTVNLFTGIIYTIDGNNVYLRGPFFVPVVVLYYIPAIVSYVFIYLKRQDIPKRTMYNLIMFPLPPAIGVILLTLFYGYSFFIPSLSISLMLIFVGIMNENIIIDYLTRLYNREHLEEYLRRKVRIPNIQFGGIMLDIDYFKNINDKYGHLQGDNALADLAKILTSSVSIDDLVARYGGDEFIIIVNSASSSNLQETVSKIHENLEKFNLQAKYVFDLKISVGAAMYNSKDHISLESYFNKLDTLMYNSKSDSH